MHPKNFNFLMSSYAKVIDALMAQLNVSGNTIFRLFFDMLHCASKVHLQEYVFYLHIFQVRSGQSTGDFNADQGCAE